MPDTVGRDVICRMDKLNFSFYVINEGKQSQKEQKSKLRRDRSSFYSDDESVSVDLESYGSKC